MLTTPSWFTLTAQNIAADSRLQSHYLNPADTEEAFEAKIDAAIPIACAFVQNETRQSAGPNKFPFSLVQFASAYPDESGASQAERRDRQAALASEAVKERVIYDLYRMMEGADNQALAAGCKAAATDLIKSLCGEIADTAQGLATNGKPNRAGWGSFSMGRAPLDSETRRDFCNPDTFGCDTWGCD